MAEHWLYEWIDEFEIKNSDHASQLLSLSGPAQRLYEIAQAVPGWHDGDAPMGKSIVAGSTMDFSGRMTCPHADCLKQQVDRLFSRVWHYFDSAVVEGPQADYYVRSFEQKERQKALELSFSVPQDVAFLLHLRELGVTEHLTFRTKPHAFCTNHIEQHALEAGIPHVIDPDFMSEAAKKLKAESRFTINMTPDGGWRFNVIHPSSSEPFTGSFNSTKKKGAKKPTKAQVADLVVKRSVASLIYDVATSRWLSLPLAEEFSYLNEPQQIPKAARESAIALQLPLPVMHGMSSRDIIKMRADMRPHFDRFQHALTLAIREQIDRDPERVNPEIARAVAEEFIRPAFAEIERSLTEAKRSFSVKVGASMAVGTTVASVGLLSSVPLVVGAGLAAVGVTLGGLHKHVDDRKEITTSDMYFLWKAVKGRRV